MALHFWRCLLGECPTHGMLNPLKTAEQNKDFKEASSVVLTMGTKAMFGEDKVIVFPKEESPTSSPNDSYESLPKNVDSIGRRRKGCLLYTSDAADE